jgi:hypothetical protein
VNTNVTLNGGSFQGNRCTGSNCEGGGLFGDDTITLTGTQFISNTSVGHAGGAWVQNDALVTNGRFERNACTAAGCQGGGLNTGSLELSGTQFISNTSVDQGAGAWAFSPATLTGARFQGNNCTGAGCKGGGLYSSSGLVLNSTDFISNSSLSNGGGAFAFAQATLAGGSFLGNQCTSAAVGGCQGGGLYSGAPLVLTSTDFISNSSLGNGGGAYAFSTTVLAGDTFQGNQCTSSAVGGCQGGGLYSSSALGLTSTDFSGNVSQGGGGGAYAASTAALAGGSFQDNHCIGLACQGGGLYASDALSLTATDFSGNTSLGGGSGAYVFTTTVLADALFQGNHCTGLGGTGCQGGGLFANRALTLTNPSFSDNTSVGDGGGAKVIGGAAVLMGGSFQDNHCTGAASGGCLGGGLNANAGLTLSGTQFIDNTSTGAGGGAFAHGGLGLVTDDPSAGSGGPAAGPNRVTGALFQGNQCTGGGCRGGGLLALGATTVTGSAFSSNFSVGFGGGLIITASSQLTLANVTLSGNGAAAAGGGLYVGGASHARLYNVTLADNRAPSGGGLQATPAATVGVSNTLIANNTGSNCAGPILFGTHNLEFPGAICAAVGPSAGFSTGDPRLAPLALNAPGTTPTQALLSGSAALHAGLDAVCAATPVNGVDQRGVSRTNDGEGAPGDACDIGAYEAGPWALLLPLVTR